MSDDDKSSELEPADEQEHRRARLPVPNVNRARCAEGRVQRPRSLRRKRRRRRRKADGTYKGFKRTALFFRQVVAELRKVIWPTRKEPLSYTWIVLIFVVIMARTSGAGLHLHQGVLFVSDRPRTNTEICTMNKKLTSEG